LKGTTEVTIDRIPVKDEVGTANLLWSIWKSARNKGKIKNDRNYNITLPGGVILGCYAKATILYNNIRKTTRR